MKLHPDMHYLSQQTAKQPTPQDPYQSHGTHIARQWCMSDSLEAGKMDIRYHTANLLPSIIP